MIKKAWAFADSCYMDDKITAPIPEGAREIGFFKVDNDYMTCHDLCDMRFISVRGSDDFKDWIENAELTEGFQEGADNLKKIVKELVVGSVQEIVFVGHSRGGAIATFLAEYCAYMLQTPCSCITFGCPKPSKKAFRDYYNKLPIDHTNIYIKGDLVATSNLHYILGYRHVGKIVELPSKFWWKVFRPFGRVKAHLRENLTQAIYNRF